MTTESTLQAGSAITYARRYSALTALSLATEDDDGQSGASRPAARQAPAPVPAPAAPRSDAERQIREMLAEFDPEFRRDLQREFKEVFGSGLSDLPVERHDEALRWFEAA